MPTTSASLAASIQRTDCRVECAILPMAERCHLILPHQAAGSSKKTVVLAGVDHDVLPLTRRVCLERPRLADRHSVIGVAE